MWRCTLSNEFLLLIEKSLSITHHLDATTALNLPSNLGDVGNYSMAEAKEETKRILRKARRRKRKHNTIILDWRYNRFTSRSSTPIFTMLMHFFISKVVSYVCDRRKWLGSFGCPSLLYSLSPLLFTCLMSLSTCDAAHEGGRWEARFTSLCIFH